MAEQLTSVRFEKETLARLRVLADVNDSSAAAEIRKAVDRYLESEMASEDFRSRFEETNQERQKLVEGISPRSRPRRP